jgi:putative lipoprotein (rSAM/lipoprotein system)
MAIIKRFHKAPFLIFKLLSFITGSVLSIFFTIGCTKGNNAISGSYGMPLADFKVSGTVRSADQHLPIKGIVISLSDTSDSIQRASPVTTDSLGKYLLDADVFGNLRGKVILHAMDLDSSLNGSFLPKDTTISLPDSAFKGASGEYLGLDSENVDLYLGRSAQ